MKEMKNTYKILVEYYDWYNPFGRPGTDGMIILKFILNSA
jgi:hypothetical protein